MDVDDNRDNKIRKRGRPKKVADNKNINNYIDESLALDCNNEEDDEIIIELPFSKIDKEVNKTKIENKTKHTIKSKSSPKEYKNLKDSNNSKDSENSDSGNNDLNIEIEKKNILINQLKHKIKELMNNETHNNIISATKEHIKTLSDLKLISYTDNKQINIVDKTNICCWWCTYDFNTLPCFLPDRYYNETFYVFGCFCSFSCAAAYNITLNDRISIRYSLLKKMYNIIFNINETNLLNREIPVAPQKEILEKYGGSVSINNFRNANTICSKEYKINIPPLVPLIIEMRETVRNVL